MYTFLPLNLIEQFRRAANIYFLVIIINFNTLTFTPSNTSQVTLILTWVIDSPVSPESWLLSLLFIVVITMVKQGYEDYLRSVSQLYLMTEYKVNTDWDIIVVDTRKMTEQTRGL